MQNTTIHNPFIKMKSLSMFATCLTLLLALTGCDRSGSASHHTFGTHTVMIVNPGEKPWGGTTSIIINDATESRTKSFVSANGKYKIVFGNDVLTINGGKYTLEKPGSSIRIKEDKVEINGAEAVPDKE